MGKVSKVVLPVVFLASYLLDGVGCNGTESNLDQCDHKPWGSHNCYSRDNIYIRCTGM